MSAEERVITFGDLCTECDGRGYDVIEYTWEYGTECEAQECSWCGGIGRTLPEVTTEEFVETDDGVRR
jgi:DnaJ-class molecular chaperone